ncbi:hypothetical protein [Rhodococcus aetherivorans]|uniref:hypothetical protein n=1 Tax=Rhodococcus aetherivorans TaxID=191292 RepID=UPI00045C5C60|nr:hypothetical protein [Rhodococcus aetherivorans]KDE12436.1 hypothetical protein N505_0115420 [Rhodococcus aetherivorans]
MRVSEKFGLGVTQASLDFVDVDIDGDVPAFIDPKAIRLQTGDWGETCQALLQSYFDTLLAAIKAKDKTKIAKLVAPTGEPNETHLGYSSGNARGTGLGRGKRGQGVVQALSESKAGTTGLLHDLEDAALFVPFVGRDVISDITTNVIRGPLVLYTQEACKLYGISIVSQHCGFAWDAGSNSWHEIEAELPRVNDSKLLLVPKSIVRIAPILNKDTYYRDFIRPYYEEIELNNPASHLVEILKDGRRKVKLKKLDALVGTSKPRLVDHSLKFEDAFPEYKSSITATTKPPLDRRQFEEEFGAEPVDFRALLDSVRAVSSGNAGATLYHQAVANLLTALFDASLGNHRLEYPIHDGRKRLDIKYDNIAVAGFFRWLSLHHPAAIIPVECKNYTADPRNPELDQLTGRFSRERGQVGILVCRQVSDKDTMRARCRDAAKDGRGFVLVLDDDDLAVMVEHAEKVRDLPLDDRSKFPTLKEQFDLLIS